MALHLLWVPRDVSELYLLIWVEECWQERAQSWGEAGNKPDTAEQEFGATALLCPCSPWINKAFINVSSHSGHAEHLHGSPALAAPIADTPDPGNSISTGCTDHSKESTEKELGRAVPKCETHLPKWAQCKPPWCHCTGDLPCPENSILREVTFLCMLT